MDSLAPGWRETGGLATQRVLGDDERRDPRTSIVPSDPWTRFRLRPSLSLDCALLLIATASVPSGIASITVSTIVVVNHVEAMGGQPAKHYGNLGMR
ncbi:MAG: hypothetical protein HQ453_12190 [Actinobacteria bacterium]|nr:hypothetical protein [Actinomycetota bacterium]